VGCTAASSAIWTSAGDADTAIGIRTPWSATGWPTAGGGGIVADSDPVAEDTEA